MRTDQVRGADHHPIATVVICADTSNIDTVFVAGHRQQDGRLLRVDLPSLMHGLDNAAIPAVERRVTPKWVLSRRISGR
jgi:hypothetical protein